MFESRRPDRPFRSAAPTGLTATLVVGTRQASSWSLRAWLAMDMARRPFDVVEIDLYAPDRAERLLEASPTGKVPVLVTGGTWIWDSLAIMEWAADMAPDLWPSHPRRRAVARSALAEMHAGFTALRQTLPMDWFARYELAGPLPPEVTADLERIFGLWESLLAENGGEGFLFGPTPMLTDLGFVPVASRLVTYGLVPDDPELRAYVERLISLPSLGRWFRDAQSVPVLPAPPPIAVGGNASPVRASPRRTEAALSEPTDVQPLVPGSARRLEEVVARARAKGMGLPPETARTPPMSSPESTAPDRPATEPPPDPGEPGSTGLPWLRRRPFGGETPGGVPRRRPPRRD